MDTETQLIEQNKNMIYKIANLYGKYSDIEDLFQAGCVGLMKAHRNYNNSYDNKFSTYAYKYILGEVLKYTREDKGVNVSRDMIKLNTRIEKATTILSQRLMREPSIEELSSYLEIPEYIIADSLKACMPIESIDRVISNDGKDITLEDTIASPCKDIDELIMLRDELNKLSDDEKRIIEKRYSNDLTQMETAKILGMSQVKVSRYENKILQKLNHNLTK
ncbi:MAG: sigma-70 family RNA polymerase sigma factor [Clostridium sp.]|nr:sigma-70 family RNA polymerase sigma factor [Clostridium sp.]MCM1444256.1 sigma-70 family RNA polymerase sigma factor [Candidatus Amulumruptor caecigallinarius]